MTTIIIEQLEEFELYKSCCKSDNSSFPFFLSSWLLQLSHMICGGIIDIKSDLWKKRWLLIISWGDITIWNDAFCLTLVIRLAIMITCALRDVIYLNYNI